MLSLLILFICSLTVATVRLPDKPNIVVIFGDDVGYGDVNILGHPTTSTPNIDRMAREGLRMLQFYSAAPVCSPSRASLLTGRLFPRAGVYAEPSNKTQTGMGTFNPANSLGMLLSETTLAQALKSGGYATGMLGKWHLGIGLEYQYMPFNRGFDSYYGLPLIPMGCSSNVYNGTPGHPPPGACMIFENSTIVAQPADVLNLDAAYVHEAKRFITVNRDRPFFFYFAAHHTHMPQWASAAFQNTTRRGIYGDALAELDWSIGEILDHLIDEGIQNQTLVIFTSDNGPALGSLVLGGEQGPFKCGKGTTYEGGVREPAIFWWPSVIRPGGVSQALASTLDVFPTVLNLAGVTPNKSVILDGYDITDLLTGKSKESPRQEMFYYSGKYLMAARSGPYKAHFWTMGSHCKSTYTDSDCWSETKLAYRDPPLLFNVNADPKERHPLTTSQSPYAEELEKIVSLVKRHNETMTFGPPQIAAHGHDPNNFPCCSPSCTPRPSCCKCKNSRNYFEVF